MSICKMQPILSLSLTMDIERPLRRRRLSPRIQNSTHKHWGRCLLDEMIYLRYWTTRLELNSLLVSSHLNDVINAGPIVQEMRPTNSSSFFKDPFIHSFIEIHLTLVLPICSSPANYSVPMGVMWSVNVHSSIHWCTTFFISMSVRLIV